MVSPILMHDMEDRSKNTLRTLLSDIQDPVFIVGKDTNMISVANNAALSACSSFNPEGELLTDIVHFEAKNITAGLAFFDNRWLNTSQDQFYWNKKLYIKLSLKQISSIPDEYTLTTIRRMIAVLLHRLRSPMTGMRGYLEMVQDVNSDNDRRKLDKVGEGLDYLFEIMDELELLHHADAFIDDEPTSTHSDAETVIQNVLLSYPAGIRNRVEIINHSTDHFHFNPTELTRLLSLLLNNVAEHLTAARQPIKIEIHTPRQLSVTNYGTPIPDDIVEYLFFPFVTTKANNLGIGLSLTQLIASRRRAAVILTENSTKTGITFTLLCSPLKESDT
ncbi:hypothetical protein BH23BAC3_BH23BAC3_00650 [soil metagenome]